MWIRADQEGNIITTADTQNEIVEAVLVDDATVPADFAAHSHDKYRFINGAIVVRSGWVEPVVLSADTTDHETILADRMAERLRAYGIPAE